MTRALGSIVGKPKAPHKFQVDDRFVLPNCCFGLEIEYEGVGRGGRTLPIAPWSEFWLGKEDNSLHNAGWEFVFNGPLFGADAADAIVGLNAHAKAAGLLSSARTGIHVHVDMRDLMPTQLIGMLGLYALYEKALYRYVGDDRDQNVFCRPWFNSSGATDMAALVVNSINNERDFEERWPVLVAQKEMRYAGLNLQSLGPLCTVEFRQLKTSMNIERIFEWINICLGFKFAALSIPFSNLSILEDVMRIGAEDYLLRYFPPKVAKVLNYADLNKDVIETGFPVAFDILKTDCTKRHPWNRPAPRDFKHVNAVSYITRRFQEQTGGVPDAVQAAREALQQQAAQENEAIYRIDPRTGRRVALPHRINQLFPPPGQIAVNAVRGGLQANAAQQIAEMARRYRDAAGAAVPEGGWVVEPMRQPLRFNDEQEGPR